MGMLPAHSRVGMSGIRGHVPMPGSGGGIPYVRATEWDNGIEVLGYGEVERGLGH